MTLNLKAKVRVSEKVNAVNPEKVKGRGPAKARPQSSKGRKVAVNVTFGLTLRISRRRQNRLTATQNLENGTLYQEAEVEDMDGFSTWMTITAGPDTTFVQSI